MGSLFAAHLPLLDTCITLIVLLSIACISIMGATLIHRQREIILIGGGLLFIAVFSIWNTQHRADITSAQHNTFSSDTIPEDKAVYRVQVISHAVEKPRTWRLETQLLARKDSLEETSLNTISYIYIRKDSLLPPPEPGDILLCRNTRFIKSNQWVVVGKAPLKRWRQIMLTTRQHVENLWQEMNTRERAVLQSLTLGDRHELGRDTRQAFADAGSMHILAVSGLHVGMIAWTLSWLMIALLGRPLEKDKLKRWCITVIPVVCLVFYAIITGLSPSVVRSVLMFSLLHIGLIIRPTRSHWNEVAASAFFILLFRPSDLQTISFILSYSAVVAILLVMPHLEQALRLPRWPRFLRFWGSIAAVSVCAQIGTLPWTLHYFNQMPLYFLLTNLFVVPWVQLVVMPLAILVIGIGSIGAFNGTAFWHFLLRVTEWSVSVLCDFNEWICQLPHAIINGHMTTVMALCMSLTLGAIFWQNKYKYLIIIVCSTIFVVNYCA